MPEAEDIDRALFANLVMMLSSSAMQQMGKLVNPLTNKAEVNLEAAQMTIDTLTMLKEKTAGNLDREETDMLAEVLSSLQMTYVQSSARPAPPQDPQDAAPRPEQGPRRDAPAEPEPTGGDAETAPPSSGEDKRKYHKSYG